MTAETDMTQKQIIQLIQETPGLGEIVFAGYKRRTKFDTADIAAPLFKEVTDEKLSDFLKNIAVGRTAPEADEKQVMEQQKVILKKLGIEEKNMADITIDKVADAIREGRFTLAQEYIYLSHIF